MDNPLASARISPAPLLPHGFGSPQWQQSSQYRWRASLRRGISPPACPGKRRRTALTPPKIGDGHSNGYTTFTSKDCWFEVLRLLSGRSVQHLQVILDRQGKMTHFVILRLATTTKAGRGVGWTQGMAASPPTTFQVQPALPPALPSRPRSGSLLAGSPQLQRPLLRLPPGRLGFLREGSP